VLRGSYSTLVGEDVHWFCGLVRPVVREHRRTNPIAKQNPRGPSCCTGRGLFPLTSPGFTDEVRYSPTLLGYPKRAGKREAIDPARVAPTYVEADYKIGATTRRACRSIGVRVENRSGAYAAARLKVTIADTCSFASGTAYREGRRKRLCRRNGVSSAWDTGGCLPRYRVCLRLGRERRLSMNTPRLNAQANREGERQKSVHDPL
jgi:hypothetical protein